MVYSRQLQAFDTLMRRLPKEVERRIEPKLIIEANKIAGRIERAAPEDSGDLKDSIAVTAPGGTTPAYSQPGGSHVAGPNQAIVTVGNSDVRYPHLVEYGTSTTAEQPFFWPAVRTYGKRAQRSIARELRKIVTDVWGYR